MKAKEFKFWSGPCYPTGIIKAQVKPLGDFWDALGFLLQEVNLDPLMGQDFTHV